MNNVILNKCLKYVKWGLYIASIILGILLIIEAFSDKNVLAIKIESIAVTVSITLSVIVNIYFVKYCDKIEAQNIKLLKVCKNNNIDIEHLDNLYVDRLVSDKLVNLDDDIMNKTIELMDGFEWSVRNGGFTFDTVFSLDELEKPEELRRTIGNASFICKDDNLNNYLKTLKKDLQVMADLTMIHSFPVSTMPGYNKMRWIEMQEEMEWNQITYSQDRIDNEKKYYESAINSVKRIIATYDEMIEYWKKSRKSI